MLKLNCRDSSNLPLLLTRRAWGNLQRSGGTVALEQLRFFLRFFRTPFVGSAWQRKIWRPPGGHDVEKPQKKKGFPDLIWVLLGFGLWGTVAWGCFFVRTPPLGRGGPPGSFHHSRTKLNQRHFFWKKVHKVCLIET